MYLIRTYIVLDERLIDPWYLVSYYTVDSIGYKGRTWYNIPVVIESRTNTSCTAPSKPRHESRTGAARVLRICSLSRKRPTREVELTGRGRFCDGCHIRHSIREAFPAKKCYLPEMSTKIKEHNRLWVNENCKTLPVPVMVKMVSSSTNIEFCIWDSRTKGPQYVYSYSHVTRLHT